MQMLEGTLRPRLGAIRAVTSSVPDLRPVEEAYTRWLHYRVVARGAIPQATAESWRAPAASGRPYLTLGPQDGEPVYLRFVADPAAAGWRALTTHGWNVTEFVVQDVDVLAASLADSPFRIIGPPASLQRFPMIRAMQVIGPCGECLYFTEVGPGSGLDLATAHSFVGRVFIVVAGGPDLAAMFRTYAFFDNAVDPPVATRVRVISLANGLPEDTLHRHGLVKLSGGTLVELDEYPPSTRARGAARGSLAPGMAIVTFSSRGRPSCEVSATVCSALLPATDAAVVVVAGATGELLELLDCDDA